MAFDGAIQITPYVERASRAATLTGEVLRAFRATYRDEPDAASVARAVGAVIEFGTVDAAIRGLGVYFDYSTSSMLMAYRSALAEIAEPAVLASRLKQDLDDLDAESERADAMGFHRSAAELHALANQADLRLQAVRRTLNAKAAA